MAMKHVLLGGGTGFIGSALAYALKFEGYAVTVMSRKPGRDQISWNEIKRNGIPSNISYVINVAGQNVLNPKKRWDEDFKKEVWKSRVNTNKNLATAIQDSNVKCFLTISGVGYYPPSTERNYNEYNKCEPYDFFSELVHAWEAAGNLSASSDCRRVTIRSGVVLGRRGGMIQQTIIPFIFGLGGPIGNGKQFMPWIHIDDLVELFIFSMKEEQVKDILNGVSPQIITNKEFAKAFGRALWMPAILPLPTFVVNRIFGEERAKLMTGSHRVYPKRVLEHGFKYCYSDIKDACEQFGRLLYTDPY